MSGELEKQIKENVKDKPTAEKLVGTVEAAGQEFPCLTCESHDECQTYCGLRSGLGKSSNPFFVISETYLPQSAYPLPYLKAKLRIMQA